MFILFIKKFVFIVMLVWGIRYLKEKILLLLKHIIWYKVKNWVKMRLVDLALPRPRGYSLGCLPPFVRSICIIIRHLMQTIKYLVKIATYDVYVICNWLQEFVHFFCAQVARTQNMLYFTRRKQFFELCWKSTAAKRHVHITNHQHGTLNTTK